MPPTRRGKFDAYGDRRFHIGSPNLEDVIRKRLTYASSRYLEFRRAAGGTEALDATDNEVMTVLNVFIDSTTKGNHNIVRLLSCVSNGDMRYALDMFRQFVSSGNTDVDKILRALKTSGRYTIPFHEFAKSAVLGSRRYYRSSLSHVVNLFLKSSAGGASHMTACRLLARLSAAESAPSAHGAGFVDTRVLLGEYRSSFGHAQDLIMRGEELLRRGLIESEPPKAPSFDSTDALRISASGAYYWRYFARSFAYLDLVHVDTGLADKGLAERLATLANITSLSVRFERVRAFVEYLGQQEAAEVEPVARVDGPYREALVPGISEQIAKEIEVIKSKTGAEDLG